MDIYGQPVEVAQILKENEEQQFFRYERNRKIDSGSHKKKIIDALYCEEVGNGMSKPRTERVIHSEEGSNILGIYSANEFRPIEHVNVPTKIDKAIVMSICFRDMTADSSNYGPIGTTSLIAVTCTDAHIHIYAYVKSRLEYWKSIPTEQIQDRIWCLKYSKQIVTAGMKDFKLKQWNFSPFVSNALIGEIGEKNDKGEVVPLHTDSITDIVEIKTPPSLITCSLDKTIKMFSMDRRVLMRTFTQHHTNGIKQLKYLPCIDRLLSRGFEVFVNIWNPENLYGDPFVGALKGHKKSIVSMDDIKTQAYVVTIDVGYECIIWDVRTMTQIQNLQAK
jgi:WD40 repeat protein